MNGRKKETNGSSDAVVCPPELLCPPPSLGEIGTTFYDWSNDEIQKQLPTEIVLMTANDNEFAACYSYMKNVKRSWDNSLGMVDFGEFGDDNVRAALIVSKMGPTPAVIAVKNAAEILQPKVILFVGICATLKPDKAQLGDVVISAKLATYADKKVRKDGTVEYRGTKQYVSRKMGNLILSAPQGWEPPLKDPTSLNVKVHRDAVMLSGPELVNNPERRQELASHFQDALGLEMEGAGLSAAAYDLDIEWAVIKAVSDFGDGSKTATEGWQPFASVMAVSVVCNMFKYRDVIKNWRHYKKGAYNSPESLALFLQQGEELLEADGKPETASSIVSDDPNSCTDGAQSLEDPANGNVLHARKVAYRSSPPTERKHLRCGKCVMEGVSQLPDDRNNWPMYKIENGCHEKICKLLDLDDCSTVPLLVALGCFSKLEADLIRKECMPNGCGMAKKALDRWGTSKSENNVGALMKILQDTMERQDVVDEIKNWKELHVCHGCGVKF